MLSIPKNQPIRIVLFADTFIAHWKNKGDAIYFIRINRDGVALMQEQWWNDVYNCLSFSTTTDRRMYMRTRLISHHKKKNIDRINATTISNIRAAMVFIIHHAYTRKRLVLHNPRHWIFRLRFYYVLFDVMRCYISYLQNILNQSSQNSFIRSLRSRYPVNCRIH